MSYRNLCVHVRGRVHVTQFKSNGALRSTSKPTGRKPKVYPEKCGTCGPANFDCVNCYIKRMRLMGGALRSYQPYNTEGK